MPFGFENMGRFRPRSEDDTKVISARIKEISSWITEIDTSLNKAAETRTATNAQIAKTNNVLGKRENRGHAA